MEGSLQPLDEVNIGRKRAAGFYLLEFSQNLSLASLFYIFRAVERREIDGSL